MHRDLAARQRLNAPGATEKRKGGLKRNKRGQTCRPRESAPSSTALAAAASSLGASSTEAAASAPTVNVNAAFVPASPASASPAPPSSPSPAPAPAASSDSPAAPASAEVAAAAAASPSPSSGSLIAVGASSGGVSVSVNVGSSGITGGSKNQGSKMGSAWPNGDWAQPSDPNYFGNYIGSKTAWYYTWSPFNVGSADSLGMEFVPMLWGPKQVGDWWNNQGSWPSSVKNALFFNEPNEVSQCNIGAGDAVSYWMNDMVPVRHSKGIAIGSAATTNAPSGLQWVQDLIQNCQNDGNSKADCTPEWVDAKVQSWRRLLILAGTAALCLFIGMPRTSTTSSSTSRISTILSVSTFGSPR